MPHLLQRGEVEYSLRAIPLGGYVAFPDDDPKSSYAPDDPNLLQNRSVVQRAIVISAGVIANVLFALAILFAQVGNAVRLSVSYEHHFHSIRHRVCWPLTSQKHNA